MDDVRAVRAHGEPERIRFDPERHPGIIKRLVLYGHSRADVAAVLGIAEGTLATWFARYPELDGCRIEAQMRGPDLVAAAYRLALGEYDEEKGEYAGGDAGMVKFLLERRHGFTRPVLRDAQAGAKELPDARLARAADRLVESMGGEARFQALVEALEAHPRGSPRADGAGGRGTQG